MTSARDRSKSVPGAARGAWRVAWGRAAGGEEIEGIVGARGDRGSCPDPTV